jgi:hypothetical protein
MPSVHRLWLGLPGYLIPFAPPAFVFQCQDRSIVIRRCKSNNSSYEEHPREPPSPSAFLAISTHSTATPRVPLSPSVLYPNSFKCHSTVERLDFTSDPSGHLHTLLRITAAAGTELAEASSRGTVTIVPLNKGLHPEGRHPSRGVAGSGFRPLPKFLDCCLP